MVPMQRSLAAVFLALMCLIQVRAEPAGRTLAVVMYALPETTWQAKFEGQFQEHPALVKRLEEERRAGGLQPLFAMEATLAGDKPVVWKQGAEQEFAEGWETPEDVPAIPRRLVKRLVGTRVEIQQDGTTEEGNPQVILKLEHHITPPKMQRISYANAATGAEREKLSVESPKFEKIEWQGKLAVWPQWRLVTSVLRLPGPEAGAGPAMRYVVFIKRL